MEVKVERLTKTKNEINFLHDRRNLINFIREELKRPFQDQITKSVIRFDDPEMDNIFTKNLIDV